MLQHLGENGRFYYKLLQEIPDGLDVLEHGREIIPNKRDDGPQKRKEKQRVDSEAIYVHFEWKGW